MVDLTKIKKTRFKEQIESEAQSEFATEPKAEAVEASVEPSVESEESNDKMLVYKRVIPFNRFGVQRPVRISVDAPIELFDALESYLGKVNKNVKKRDAVFKGEFLTDLLFKELKRVGEIK